MHACVCVCVRPRVPAHRKLNVQTRLDAKGSLRPDASFVQGLSGRTICFKPNEDMFKLSRFRPERFVQELSVYTQTSAFSYSLFYLQNQISNYKQTTKSTVCVNYDYATGCNTAVFQFCSNKSAKFPGKSWHITEQFYDFARP